jgi:hypothetical protein
MRSCDDHQQFLAEEGEYAMDLMNVIHEWRLWKCTTRIWRHDSREGTSQERDVVDGARLSSITSELS